MRQDAERWLERLDAMGSYGSLAEIRDCVAEAPEGAQQTSDYWYACGVVDARTEAEARGRGPRRNDLAG